MARVLEETSREGSIKHIDSRSVHQICSGQVILSLATAVKELIENSIDAGATNVEIKLKEFGVESFEVNDNGSGIEEKDFEAIALKHCTSKLREFDDLNSVDTFGFRGEALSSLCALSKVTITTRHKFKNFGSKLEFDYNGKLISVTPCARETGTTVIVSQLFHTLPVRYKEFQRNIKKEFPKLNAVLQAYGIISKGVRITCLNITEKSKKVVLLSTHGAETTIENIASIFGARQVRSLMKFEQTCPSEDILEGFNISPKKLPDSKNIFSIDGYISFVDHKCGRSSLDRQFFFINKRPCDIAKISRLVNEVYHMFNRHQNPFVFLDINLKTDMVDVNLTPDKRQIFIENEKLLLAVLKSSLLKMFSDSAGNYQMNMTQQTKSPMLSLQNVSPSTQICDGGIEDGNLSTSFSGQDGVEINGVVKENNLKANCTAKLNNGSRTSVSSILSKFKSRFSKDKIDTLAETQGKKHEQLNMDRFTFKVTKEKDRTEVVENGDIKDDSLDGGSTTGRQTFGLVGQLVEEKNVKCFDRSAIPERGEKAKLQKDFQKRESESSSPQKCVGSYNIVHIKCEMEEGNKGLGTAEEKTRKNSDDIKDEQIDSFVVCRSSLPVKVDIRDDASIPKAPSFNAEYECTSHSPVFCESEVSGSNYDGYNQVKRPRLTSHGAEISFDINKIKEHWCSEKMDTDSSAPSQLLGFHAKISPQQNNAAEEELQKYVSKEAFRSMEIIGQFNLGFIIAKVQDDLFIIDQHASDEKYNFETLQKEHCLKGQRLIQPRPLELTPVNESILLDNLEIFRRNGFEFNVDQNQQAGQKVKLLSLPTSKNWTFDIQDIEELIFMLSDNPGVMCRPSRVRSMFASRACRMSTMVGNALNISQMKTLVSHMAEIEHPWNCPHGRPTMRHLVNLKRIDVPSDAQPEE
ncbi:mismatch repair endonuclease PMS2-like isoform X1 [Rhopilema esculentum]|uniref:mismatch repair endonuclease PMS2-like isoform X1 n=1 Tax=Rhopilema esculentum TaxID=499914 RepID=UPI0031D5F690|eukprot:gene1348-15748_t